MKKRPTALESKGAPGGVFRKILPGAVILTALSVPLALWAQTDEPPPVHPFGLTESQSPDQALDDAEALVDFYAEAAEGAGLSDGGYAPLPSLPPSVPTVQPVQPAAEAPPATPAARDAPAASPAPANSFTAPVDLQDSTPVSSNASGVSAGDDYASPVVSPDVYIPSADDLPGVDPFAPPVAAPLDDPANAAPAESVSQSFPLGQGTALPSPQWVNAADNVEPAVQHQFITGSPLPQYDASQSNWQSLEVGQADRVSNTPAAGSAQRAGSVSTVPLPPESASVPTAPAGSLESRVDAVMDAAIDATMEPSAAEAKPGSRFQEPSGRDQLKLLFSDMLPQQPVAPAPVPAVAPLPANPPAPTDGEEGGSAILKAGGLLTTEQYGQAGILTPLNEKLPKAAERSPAPGTSAQPPATPKTGSQAQAASVKSAVSAGAKSTASVKPAPAAKAATSAARKKTGKSSSAPAVAASGIKLMIINETGNDRVGELYRSVLSKIGYKVVSVGNSPPSGGQTGRTVINYRPGAKAKAQTVARHLPGKKVLVQAKGGQTLAQEIMVYIR